jgi:hypothetical protein
MPQAKWVTNLNSPNEPASPRISPRNEVPIHPFEFKAYRRSQVPLAGDSMASACQLRLFTSMTDVQIAIKDQSYAEELRRLLVADGKHRVHVVHRPTLSIQGVVVLDAALLENPILPEGHDSSRCVVFSHNEIFDVNSIWKAGIRHLIHADCPPPIGRLVVLAAEMRLNAGGPNSENCDESADLVYPLGHRGGNVELWEQIRGLRNALTNAVWNSGEVAKAMGVLQRSRREVRIEIDAVLLTRESSGRDCETAEDNANFDGMSMFDATDRLFLQALKISDR